MLYKQVSLENIVTNHKSIDLYNQLEFTIDTYETEDDNYYKPKNIKEWYYEWDFKNYNPNIYSHGFHQYPAKFIPQLARKLLRVFTDENSLVLDNFMGSGTTLIECMLLNIKEAIGIELNPFACFMAKVKTTPINPNTLTKYFVNICNQYVRLKKVTPHKFYNIEFWFKPKQIMDLSKLREIIISLQDSHIKNFFLICMSEVIRRVSLTNHSGFKLHRDKDKLREDFNPNVLWHFENVAKRNIILMNDFYKKTINSKTKVKIIQGDSRKNQMIEKNSIDFILTSPPYGDSRTTVAYGQFSRLSWLWIENDGHIHKLDESLLGGKKINNNDRKGEILDYSKTLKSQYNELKDKDFKRGEEVLSFYVDLFDALINANEYLKNGKYFVLVTGNRTVKNIFIRTDLIISELSEKLGLKTEKILYRNIINKRMPSKNSPTNKKGESSNTMLKENIIFLRKV